MNYLNAYLDRIRNYGNAALADAIRRTADGVLYHTPGHSKGSVTYCIEGSLYCGDLLFKESFGRYDFEGGDFEQLKNSVDAMLSLNGNYIIYSGHGPSTSSDYERARNPMYLYGRI